MQQPITNPPVPFVGPIQGGFAPGTMVRIQGQVPPTADRFNINLHCGPPPSDVALHLSVRLLQSYIARNSLQDEGWGSEEDNGSLPIAPGQSFEIIILCDPGSYKIAVNGNHFCEFRHRIPFQQVSHLAIDGDVSLGVIAFEGGASGSSAPPPSGGPDYAYGPPPGQYGPPPPQGAYGSSPYGGPPRPHNMPMPSAPPISMPLPSSVPIPLPRAAPPINMPMPSSARIPPAALPPGPPAYMPPLPPAPMYAPPAVPSQMPLYGAPPPIPSQMPSYGAPPLMYQYGAPPSYIPPPGPMGVSTYQAPLNAYAPQYQYQNKDKSQMSNIMKYGLPIAGVGLAAGVGAYALSQVGRSRSWSCSSSSSSCCSD